MDFKWSVRLTGASVVVIKILRRWGIYDSIVSKEERKNFLDIGHQCALSVIWNQDEKTRNSTITFVSSGNWWRILAAISKLALLRLFRRPFLRIVSTWGMYFRFNCLWELEISHRFQPWRSFYGTRWSFPIVRSGKETSARPKKDICFFIGSFPRDFGGGETENRRLRQLSFDKGTDE